MQHNLQIMEELCIYNGKVRDIYRLGDDYLLMKATDRVSSFDKHIGIINDTTPHAGKWRWPDNADFLNPMDDINLPILRYADCLLMWSEAEMERYERCVKDVKKEK